MRKLRDLMFNGTQTELMKYVNGEFKKKIDKYIECLDKVSTIEDEYTKLQIKSIERQKILEEVLKSLEK